MRFWGLQTGSIRWIVLLRGGVVCGSKSQLMASIGRHLLLETKGAILGSWLVVPSRAYLDRLLRAVKAGAALID